MILVIAEKPSVSKSLANVIGANGRKDGFLEGNGYLVSWCLGHLAEYVMPDAYDPKYERWNFTDLPIIPDTWKLSVAETKSTQFHILSDLLNRSDLEYVVNACDAGREGESIFRRVYALSGSRAPIKRLWISSMEDQAIQEGFEQLRDGSEYENLYQAAECRAKADWLVGLNATRAFTTIFFKRLVVGRVQTPTLAILADRQKKILHFKKEAYYTVSLTGDGLTVTSENILDEDEAKKLEQQCQGKSATVTEWKKEQKKQYPPKLYDLTTLQREANRFFGYTAQETLESLQEMYENKLVTYPRTDSQYITENMAETVHTILSGIPKIAPFLSETQLGDQVDRLINNGKVTDHHALLPTKESLRENPDELTERQKNLFYLIVQRLAQAVSSECIYEETEVEAACEGHLFKAKGKIILESGFQDVVRAFQNLYRKENEKEEKGAISAALSAGDVIPEVVASKTQHFTSPPKPYSEDTLLSAMETAGNKEFDSETEKKGLGTPATRATVIEKLVHSGYAVRKGKQIIATEDGMELIDVLPEYLKSANMTAQFENRLLQMERGEVTAENFLQGITDLLSRMLDDCRAIPEEERQRFDRRESIGSCPLCGKPVYESRKNFYCSDKSCRFALWKENRYLENMRKTIDKKMASDLLKKGKTHVKDFYSSKKGSTFEANLVLKIENARPVFQLSFPKNEEKTKGKKPASRKK